MNEELKPGDPTNTDLTRMRVSDSAEETSSRAARAQAAVGTVGTGAIIDGRYLLEFQLGEGGMGVVYRARDLLMEEHQDSDPFVALKVIAESIREFPQAPMALQRECKRAQKLSHPNIVRVFHFGRAGDTYYLTMELLQGQSLERVVYDAPSGLHWACAAPLIEQICAGLSYAHGEGIVHSDIKPSNLLITDRGVLKILDFGIATPLRKTGSLDSETKFNPRHMGALSPRYSSLEMHLGMDADPQDDVFSAACVIYEMLTGRHPFRGETILKALERGIQPEAIPSLNAKQNRILLHGLALRRDSRLASMTQLQNGLLESGSRAIAVGKSQSASDGAALVTPVKIKPPLWLGLIVTVAGLLGLLSFWYYKNTDKTLYNDGVNYMGGIGVRKDAAHAAALFRKAADRGYAPAQTYLAYSYETGVGVTKDEVQAVAWYQKAADQGYAAAQSNLGTMYDRGAGVQKDEAQAAAWFQKAADQGDAAGQSNLGTMYDRGAGVPKDEAQAAAWFQKAADQGQAAAQFNLGTMYERGAGVPKDEAQAAAWYQKAADQGQAAAQNNLGGLYLNGVGVTKDETQAAAWYRRAADQGGEGAQKASLSLRIICTHLIAAGIAACKTH